MRSDDGVSPVVAVALLIGLVAVAGAVIGLTMFAALEDTAGALPDVRFQVSADGQSLYHAGGDALPLKNLIFYNTSAKDKDLANITRFVMKEGGDKDIWRTGELLTLTFVGDNVLKTLSIVGLDSRNRPTVLWMGADAVVLPVGDMVPDEWTWTPTMTQIPKPEISEFPEPNRNEGEFEKLIQNTQGVKFGETLLFSNGKLVDNITYSVISGSSVNISTTVKPMGGTGNKQNTTITVNVYSLTNDAYIPIWNNTVTDTQGKNEVRLEIPNSILKHGDLCYVTIYREIQKKDEKTIARKTVVITLGH